MVAFAIAARDAALYGALGLAVGTAFFASLRFNVALYLGHDGFVAALLLQLARLALIALVLALAARQGAAPMIWALAGVLFARGLLVRGGAHG